MPGEDSRYPADWKRLAEKDLARVSRALRDEDPELAGFCLQQAVEKFLKAFLLGSGWALRRTHDLGRLLDEARRHDADLVRYRAVCQRITDYYVVERYPLVGQAGPAVADVRAALESVRGLIDRLRHPAPE